MEKIVEGLLLSHAAIGRQLETVAKTFAHTAKDERINNLRDVILWKLLLHTLQESEPSLMPALRKKLDFLLLSIGDDAELCKAIGRVNAILDGAG